MDIYKTGLERALGGSRRDIAGQSIFLVQSRIHQLKEQIIPIHQACHNGGDISDIERNHLSEAQTERKELHAKNHELIRILKSGSRSPELEIATKGIWNWGITQSLDR